MRLPRPAAPGDRPGAAGARVRDVDRFHGAQRPVPHHPAGAAGAGGKVTLIDNPANFPGPVADRDGRRTVHLGVHDHPGHVPGEHHHSLPGKKGRAEEHDLPRREEGGAGLRDAAGRGGFRFLRPAEIGEQGLCILRLPAARVPRDAALQAGHPDQRQDGRCPVPARVPGQRLPDRAPRLRASPRRDPAPAVQDRHPGRDRQPDHSARDRECVPQGRHCEVLRRGHHAKEKAAGKAERRKEEDEDGRGGGAAPVRIPRRAEDLRGLTPKPREARTASERVLQY